MSAVIGDPREAGEAGPAGDQREAGEANVKAESKPSKKAASSKKS